MRAFVGDSTITSFCQWTCSTNSPQTGSVTVRQAAGPWAGAGWHISRNGATIRQSPCQAAATRSDRTAVAMATKGDLSAYSSPPTGVTGDARADAGVCSSRASMAVACRPCTRPDDSPTPSSRAVSRSNDSWFVHAIHGREGAAGRGTARRTRRCLRASTSASPTTQMRPVAQSLSTPRTSRAGIHDVQADRRWRGRSSPRGPRHGPRLPAG